MPKQKNRRNSYRINETVSLELKLLARIEPEDEATNFERRRIDFGVVTHLAYGAEKNLPQMRVIERKHPEIATYLKFLEKQIESLSKRVAKDTELVDERVWQTANLSATGIQFETSEVMEAGSCLEVAMIIKSTGTRILSHGELVRVEQKADRLYCFSVEFKLLHAEDQEALIKHIHQRQMAQLRSDKS
jgi:hypothetical protein